MFKVNNENTRTTTFLAYLHNLMNKINMVSEINISEGIGWYISVF